jgi:hypothetical protein
MVKLTTAVIAAASVLLGATAFAQTSPSGRMPTQADSDDCQREAQLTGGNALPGARPKVTAPPTSGLGATNPPASVSGPTGAAGATGGAGALSGGSTLSGSQATQPDPAFLEAYRDCMRRRGF